MITWKTNQKIEELIEEIKTITEDMDQEEQKYFWDTEGHNFPVAEKYKEKINEISPSDEIIWACNDEGFCLTGLIAEDITHISDL